MLAPGGGELGRAAAELCRGLGARVELLDASALVDEPAVTTALDGTTRRAGALHTVVVDAAALFAGAPGREDDAPLRAALDGAWTLSRAAALGSMIDAPEGGKIVLVAPPPNAGDHAEAARSGLENTARTLSIEWARHHIRVTAIAPGKKTDPGDVAALVAYLASPGGDYFSGCLCSLT